MNLNFINQINAMKSKWGRIVGICMLAASLVTQANAQTALISPTGAGGFELGSTFAANGWTVVNKASTSVPNWSIATANLAQGAYTFTKSGNNAAFITNSPTANTWTYGVTTTASTVHLYRNVTFLSGQTDMRLSFRWNANGESTWDVLYVYLVPTTRTPDTTAPSSNTTTVTGWPGTGTSTLLGSINLAAAGGGSLANITIPAATVGNAAKDSTWKLVFTWKNDGGGGGEPPAAIDDISLTSQCPNLITGVTTNSIGTTTANLSWATLTGATGYSVRYKRISDPVTVATWITPVATATNSITLSGLVPNTAYEYQIAAAGTSCGSFTSSFNFTTACAGPTVVAAPATRCGQGTVTLNAVTPAATAIWYTSAVGGTPIFTGSPFVTPNLTSNTTYYVAARTIAGVSLPVAVGTGTIPSSSFDGVYYHLNGGKKTQYFFTANELIAAGLSAGNITSASFNVTAAGTSYADFNISMKNTASTAMTTTLETGLQGVYNSASVTPIVGANNYSFSTPFPWDGVSNVIMEVCWSNNNTGGSSAVTTMNAPGFICTSYIKADNQLASTLCVSTATGVTTGLRPNVIFGNQVTCESPRTAVPVTITAAPAITVSSPQSGGVCTGTTVTITATSANTGYKYTWTPLDSGSTINRVPTATTTFVVTATDTSLGANAGCVVKDSIRINVNAKPPTPVISPNPITICEGSSTTYTAASTVTGFGQLSVRWINVTGLFRNAALTTAVTATDTIAASIFAAPVTTQSYRAVSYIQGCRSDTSAAATVTVAAKFSTAITVTGSSTTCAPNTITLSAPTGSYTYQWKLGGTNISGATSRTYNAPTTGAYTVTVTATASPNCSYTTPTATNITINPQPPTTITAGGSLLFCTGGSVTLSAPTPPTGTTYTYQWNNGGTPIPGQTLANYSATTAGSYTVTVTNTTTTCSATTPTPTVTTIGSPAAPISAAAVTNTICDRDTIRLRTNNGPNLTYQWYRGGTAAANAIPGATDSVYKAFLAGTYYVMVSVTGQPSCANTSTGLTVSVNPIPVVSITAATATTFCQGGSVVLSAPAGYNYQWRIGAAPATTPNNAQTYTANTTGSFTAIVTDPATGCFATSNAINVTVNPLPSATITTATTTTLCAGNSVTLNANTGTGLTYQWLLAGNPAPGISTGASYTTSAAGSYSVRVTNANSCVATSSATAVTVVALPSATVTPTGPVNLCTGDTLTLTGPTGTGYTYQWKNGSTNALGASTAKDYKVSASGTYTVIVTANGCSVTSAATTVTLLPAPSALMSPTAASTACDSVVLTSASTGVTYQWRFNGNNIVGATNPAYTAVTSGSYSLRVTGTNGCSAVTPAAAITVNPSPTGIITYSSPLVFCQGGAVVLNTYAGANLSYEWRRDITPIAGANTPNYIASEAGNYTVKVVNTATGCSRVSNGITVRVNPLPVPTIQYNAPNNELNTVQTFALYHWIRNNQPITGGDALRSTYHPTSNGAYSVMVTDSNGCTSTSTIVFVNSVGIKNTPAGAKVKIYPNPTTGVLHVDAPVKVNLVIRDITGKAVVHADDATELNIENLADGMYLLYISDAQGQLIRAEKITKSSN